MNWSNFRCEPETCLSEIVFEIVCEAGLCAETGDSSSKSNPVTAACCLNKDGILNWDLLGTCLPESEETIEYYKRSVEVLAPLFHRILSYYQQLTLEDFKSTFDKHLSWISQKSMVFRCFELLQSGSVTATNHTALLLTSLIERGLGDIVLLKVRHCPSLLRDLLSLGELKDILSPVTVQLLRVLIGPPISLNLRNLLWHGFPSPTEIHPQYSYTLLCVIISIGSHLHEKALMSRIPFRQQFFSVDLPCIFPEFVPSSHTEPVRQVFCEGSIFLSSMKLLWLLALQLFSEKRFGECVAILLPQLEHALRRIYVTVNNCPQRLMTAQNSTLFTTFDEILNKYLDNGAENQLRKFVGDSYLMLLLDFLVYPLGPRIRDHVSHGEVILADVPVNTAQHLIWLCCLLALRLLPDDSPLPENQVFECVQQKMNEYKSIFHPLSVVKQKICSLAQSLSRWSAIPRPDVALIKSDRSHQASDQHKSTVTRLSELNISQSDSESPHAISALKAAMAFELFLQSGRYESQAENQATNLQGILVPFSDCGNLVERKLSELSQNTVYRYQSSFAQAGDENGSQGEEEILGILSKVLSTLLNASAQIYDVLFARHDQWQKKELRSRQRNTYVRMIEGVDLISDVLRVILFVSLVSFCKLDDLTPQKSIILIRFLKKVQKYSENLFVQTNVSCNRWDEAVVQSLELIAMTASLESK